MSLPDVDSRVSAAASPEPDPVASVLGNVLDYWLSTRQIAERASLSEPAATVLLKRLVDEGQVETPRGTYLGVLWRRRRSGPPSPTP